MKARTEDDAAQRRHFRARDWAIAVVAVVAALLLVAGLVRSGAIGPGSVRPGKYGLAVAEFDSGGLSVPSATGRELSQFVAETLRREIQSSPGLRDRVEVMSAPLIQGDQEARAFAVQNGVQLMIWGRVADGEHQTFIPTVAVLDPLPFRLWNGVVPVAQEAPLTGHGSVELGQTSSVRESAFIDYVIGLLYLSRSNFRQAVERFDSAIAEYAHKTEGEPTLGQQDHRPLAVFHLALGRAHARLGDLRLAREHYQLALQQDPASAAPHIGLGNLAYGRGDCAAALQAYDRAIQLASYDSAPWYSRGNAHYCLGRYENAMSDYREAIKHAPPQDQSVHLYHLVLGATLCHTGRTAEGLDELNLADAGNLVRSVEVETQTCARLARAAAENVAPTRRATRSSGSSASAATPTSDGGTRRSATQEYAPSLPVAAITAATAQPSLPYMPRLPRLFVFDLAPTRAAAPLLGPTSPPRAVANPTVAGTPTYFLVPMATMPPPNATSVPAPADTRPPAPVTTQFVPPTQPPLPTLTDTPAPVWTPVPPTDTATEIPPPTWTPLPPAPTDTPVPEPTWTPLLPPPTETPAPEATVTPLPSDTPAPEPSPTAPPTAQPQDTKPPRRPTKTPRP